MKKSAKKPIGSSGKKLALKGILFQLLVAVILLSFVALVQVEYVIASLLGCLSFIVPHSIFAYWVFRFAGASKNELVAQSFSQGMKIKLLLTSMFFVIAFFQLNVHPLPLLGAYAIIMVSQWLAMFWLKE
ncbi:ATP synthase subunit I [Glaciecola petra]|uniref:ATP synthase subunit I n=1 Tax=Glaciecola petra TaxID=3075602 RepID=A0ABU2ZQG9_9ALTE|nr:ATP synthase subunit I [Aestuariibacter sp. P117]MDT0594850.1 ATP synthase subunit I [Aestuariibacter sp. P117]